MNGITKKPPSSSQKSSRRGRSAASGGSTRPRTDDFAESSFESARPGAGHRPNISLGAEGLVTGFELAAAATNPIHHPVACSWLHQYLPQYQGYAGAAIQNLLADAEIHIPKLPDPKDCQSLISTVSKKERAKKHYGLLTGDPMHINGTFEVADWVSGTLHLTASQSGLEDRDHSTLNDNSTWGKFGVSKQVENRISLAFRGVYDDVKFLHQMRTMVSFYRNGYYCGLRDPAVWAGYHSMCAVAILSHLKVHGRVLIPLDFMLTNSSHVTAAAAATAATTGLNVPITGAHATCAVIEQSTGVNEYRIHHFESNGTLGQKMTKKEMNERRTTNDSEIQRHWTFSPDMVTPTQNPIAASPREKLRIFARTTFTGTLSIGSSNNAGQALAEDIALLLEMLFPENYTPLNEMDEPPLTL